MTPLWDTELPPYSFKTEIGDWVNMCYRRACSILSVNSVFHKMRQKYIPLLNLTSSWDASLPYRNWHDLIFLSGSVRRPQIQGWRTVLPVQGGWEIKSGRVQRSATFLYWTKISSNVSLIDLWQNITKCKSDWFLIILDNWKSNCSLTTQWTKYYQL